MSRAIHDTEGTDANEHSGVRLRLTIVQKFSYSLVNVRAVYG